MSRNFALGSRDMLDAGRMALVKDSFLSFSSVNTITSRWNQFVKFLKLICGIKRMEHITKEHILEFSRRIVDMGKSPAYHRNLISAINVVMLNARRDKKLWLSPTKECYAPSANYICTESKALPEKQHNKLLSQVSERLSVQLRLQRSLGLRFKESCLLDAKSALRQAKKSECIHIIEGTKGGRRRRIKASGYAIQALEDASVIQDRQQSLIPEGQSFIQYSRLCYLEMQDTGATFHQERHAYAQHIYKQAIKVECPVAAHIKHGKPHLLHISNLLNITLNQAKKIDKAARYTVSSALGHFRFGVSNAYVG